MENRSKQIIENTPIVAQSNQIAKDAGLIEQRQQGEIRFVADPKKKIVIIEALQYIDGKISIISLTAKLEQARELAKTLRVRASQADGIY